MVAIIILINYRVYRVKSFIAISLCYSDSNYKCCPAYDRIYRTNESQREVFYKFHKLGRSSSLHPCTQLCVGISQRLFLYSGRNVEWWSPLCFPELGCSNTEHGQISIHRNICYNVLDYLSNFYENYYFLSAVDSSLWYSILLNIQ